MIEWKVQILTGTRLRLFRWVRDVDLSFASTDMSVRTRRLCLAGTGPTIRGPRRRDLSSGCFSNIFSGLRSYWRLASGRDIDLGRERRSLAFVLRRAQDAPDTSIATDADIAPAVEGGVELE